MFALTSSDSTDLVRLVEHPEPTPLPNEAVVEPKFVSLNRGEVKALEVGATGPGLVVGWDVAGVVRDAAADGSGPAAGTRVVGIVESGAWAEQVAVPTSQLAELPSDVSFEQASTLPIAALTALYAVRAGGNAVGKRVLVLGASGGVGRFAVQLSSLGGARVTAVSSSAQRAAGLRELGADEVLGQLVANGSEFDIVLDGVGGRQMGAAMQRVADYGIVVAYASSDTNDVSFPASSFRNHAGARVYALNVFAEMSREQGCSRDLASLVSLMSAGRLTAQIDIEESWRTPGRAFSALLNREVVGKAVLRID